MKTLNEVLRAVLPVILGILLLIFTDLILPKSISRLSQNNLVIKTRQTVITPQIFLPIISRAPQVIFADEFNGNRLDPMWKIEKGPGTATV
jgi:hypothetical protein